MLEVQSKKFHITNNNRIPEFLTTKWYKRKLIQKVQEFVN